MPGISAAPKASVVGCLWVLWGFVCFSADAVAAAFYLLWFASLRMLLFYQQHWLMQLDCL